MPALIQKAANTMRVLGGVLVVLGLLCAFVPRGVGLTIGVLIGGLLVIAGLVRVVFAWVATSWGSALLRFTFGVLGIVAGIYLVGQPDLAPRVIVAVAAVYLILDGIVEIAFALRLPPAAGGASMIVGGIVSVALGVMIWQDWPLPGGQMLGIVIGVKLVVQGVVILLIAQGARRIDEALAQASTTGTQDVS